MSLYRKYRPQTFEDVVGQEHIAQTLRNALSSDPLRVSHAYLFCGPRGTGKTTSARLLAKCLNCEQGPTPTPCNQCDFCTRVRDNQTVMDLVEIDAASNTGVDNVREAIIEKVNTAPAQGRYRIYIIDEVHMLSTSSFNALLKTLEEPPAHAVFVLATTDAHKVPPTISSRCQRFDFRRVGPADIVGRLQYVAQNEGIALESAAARLIAQSADGALRDALTLLEQVTAFSAENISEADVRLVLGTVSQELMGHIMDAVANRDALLALQQIEIATEEGVSFGQLTRDLTNYCRDLLLLSVGFEGTAQLTESEKQSRSSHARSIGRARLLSCVETLRAAEKEMRQSTDHRLLLELALVRAAGDQSTLMPEVAARVAPILSAVPPVATPAPQRPVAPPIAAVEARDDVMRAPQSTLIGANGKSASQSEAPLPIWRIEEGQSTLETSHNASNGAQSTLETVHSEAQSEAQSATNEAVPSEEIVDSIVIVPTEEAALETAEATAVEVPVVKALSATPVVEVDAVTEVESAASRRKGRRIHNLQEFQELWPAVLMRIKKKIGITSAAYLNDATAVEFTDKEAVVEFRREFHYEKACEAAKRLPFEQVLNECLATPHILRFRLAEAKAKPVVVEAAPVEEDDEDEDADVLAYAKNIFAGEVVGRSGAG